MPEIDPADLIELTTAVVAAYVSRNAVPLGEVPVLIGTVHDALNRLGKTAPPEAQSTRPTPPVSIKKSMTDDYLVSLEDGRRYKALKRHLTKHGLTPAEYRAKWNLPTDYPMVAPAYAAKRSALAKASGLGAQRRKR